MNIGKNIKRLRLKKKMTQRELGTQIGVTDSMIAQLERGTKTLTVPLGKEIAKVLNCSLEDLAK